MFRFNLSNILIKEKKNFHKDLLWMFFELNIVTLVTYLRKEQLGKYWNLLQSESIDDGDNVKGHCLRRPLYIEKKLSCFCFCFFLIFFVDDESVCFFSLFFSTRVIFLFLSPQNDTVKSNEKWWRASFVLCRTRG